MASKAGENNFGKSLSAVPTIMLGQVDITRRYASVDRRRISAIDRMLPIIITGDCTHKSLLGTDEGQNFQIQINEERGIMEDRIIFQKQETLTF